jgi:hypothetical protein
MAQKGVKKGSQPGSEAPGARPGRVRPGRAGPGGLAPEGWPQGPQGHFGPFWAHFREAFLRVLMGKNHVFGQKEGPKRVQKGSKKGQKGSQPGSEALGPAREGPAREGPAREDQPGGLAPEGWPRRAGPRVLRAIWAVLGPF